MDKWEIVEVDGPDRLGWVDFTLKSTDSKTRIEFCKNINEPMMGEVIGISKWGEEKAVPVDDTFLINAGVDVTVLRAMAMMTKEFP